MVPLPKMSMRFRLHRQIGKAGSQGMKGPSGSTRRRERTYFAPRRHTVCNFELPIVGRETPADNFCFAFETDRHAELQ